MNRTTPTPVAPRAATPDTDPCADLRRRIRAAEIDLIRQTDWSPLQRRIVHAALNDGADGLLEALSSSRCPDFNLTMATLERNAGHGLAGRPRGYWQTAEKESTWRRTRHHTGYFANSVARRFGTAYTVGIINAALPDDREALASLDGLDNLNCAELLKVMNALYTIEQRFGLMGGAA